MRISCTVVAALAAVFFLWRLVLLGSGWLHQLSGSFLVLLFVAAAVWLSGGIPFKSDGKVVLGIGHRIGTALLIIAVAGLMVTMIGVGFLAPDLMVTPGSGRGIHSVTGARVLAIVLSVIAVAIIGGLVLWLLSKRKGRRGSPANAEDDPRARRR